jgi:nickel-dependent lactate racemase
MSVWCIRGREATRFDGVRHFGRPPVLAPPAWALAEQVWRGIGASPAIEEAPEPPHFEELRAAIPAHAGRVVLVVPDGTRTGPWRDLLPPLLRALRNGTPDTAERSLLVAGGVHAVQAPDALERHLFPGGMPTSNPLEGWVVTQNGDKEFRDHVSVGSTRTGTPVRLHPDYVRADWRVLLGEISWHYFAGFGGGRKLVFPGLADPDGVAANHRLAVVVPPSAEGRPEEATMAGFEWRAECGPGLLHGNPVHQDLLAAVALLPPDWVVNAVEDPPFDPDPSHPVRFPHAVVQGRYPAAFEEAAALFERSHRVPLTQAPAALVADAGGAPRDASFLQAHKSLQHALRFLAPGGRLLLAAECAEGLGSSTLARFAADPTRFRPLAGADADPMGVVHIQTLVALRRAVRAAQVGLWSDLPAGAVRALGMHPLTARDEALDWVRGEGGTAWGWLPRAERFLPQRSWRGGCLR